MGKQEVEELERKKMDAQKGVIISVYEESPTQRSPQMDPVNVKKSKPKSVSVSKKPNKTTRTRGYDRKAQLLTYARELRNADSQQVQWPRIKPKNWKWVTKPLSLCCPSRQSVERTISRWKYERIPLEENTEKLDIDHGNKTTTKKTKSPLLRKLRCILNELSCKSCQTG